MPKYRYKLRRDHTGLLDGFCAYRAQATGEQMTKVEAWAELNELAERGDAESLLELAKIYQFCIDSGYAVKEERGIDVLKEKRWDDNAADDEGFDFSQFELSCCKSPCNPSDDVFNRQILAETEEKEPIPVCFYERPYAEPRGESGIDGNFGFSIPEPPPESLRDIDASDSVSEQSPLPSEPAPNISCEGEDASVAQSDRNAPFVCCSMSACPDSQYLNDLPEPFSLNDCEEASEDEDVSAERSLDDIYNELRKEIEASTKYCIRDEDLHEERGMSVPEDFETYYRKLSDREPLALKKVEATRESELCWSANVNRNNDDSWEDELMEHEATNEEVEIEYYDEAQHILDILAQDDVPEALYELGVQNRFSQFISRKPNKHKSLAYIRAAAESGHFQAIGMLQSIYESERTPKAERADILGLYEKAVPTHGAKALEAIAGCYAKGISVPRNYAKALEYYNRAADAGCATALTSIGWFHYDGSGVPKDKAEAAAWFRKAADCGEKSGMTQLAKMLLEGDGFPKDTDAAMPLLMQLSKSFSDWADERLGDLFLEGVSVPYNPVKAMDYYMRIGDAFELDADKHRRNKIASCAPDVIAKAKAGHADAMYFAALCYANGLGVVTKESLAQKWFAKGAELGSPECMFEVAERYFFGRNVEMDRNKAEEMYAQCAEIWQRRADEGDADATYNLAQCYETGKGVIADAEKANELYAKALSRGSKAAQRHYLADLI